MSSCHSQKYEELWSFSPSASSTLSTLSGVSIAKRILQKQTTTSMEYLSFNRYTSSWFPVPLKLKDAFLSKLLIEVTLLASLLSYMILPSACCLSRHGDLFTNLETTPQPFKNNGKLVNLSQTSFTANFFTNYQITSDYINVDYSYFACKNNNTTVDTITTTTSYRNSDWYVQDIEHDTSSPNTFGFSHINYHDFNYSVIGNYLCHHSSTGNEMSKAGCHAENERKITVIQQIETVKSNEYPIYFQKYQTNRSQLSHEHCSVMSNYEGQDTWVGVQAKEGNNPFYKRCYNQLELSSNSYSSIAESTKVHELTAMMLTSHLDKSVTNNKITSNAVNWYGNSHPVRMDQKRIHIVDHPSLSPSAVAKQSIPDSIYKSSSSINDISHSLTIELSPSSKHKKDNEDNNKNPILSFQYVEPHTVELLVVITERMKQQFGSMINEYLLSTMTTVSTLLRHPSLKTSIQLSIVDIIILDPIYARRHNLEDWLNSKQEQVMARFCKWVNRLRSSTFTWDSAILLNVGHFKSTALGVAHYRSMCNPESSCLAVLDRGFGTGHIIAHELGHQLGAKHDFELNSDCGLQEQNRNTDIPAWSGTDEESYWNPDVHQYEFTKRDTIMSGTLYFDNFPLRWSACSRQAIHSFIESNTANCLRRLNAESTLYSAEKLAGQYVDNRPGRIFSLNQQCEFVLKIRGTQFCGQMLPVCRQLYCQDSEHKSCLPMEAAWAEGTPCGDNKWCIQGQCVSTNENPTPLHGNWGEWGPWSACSRSCGGGVQFSERECNNPEPQHGGDFCHGTRTRMRSCGTEPCEKVINIRQILCDQIDGPYTGQLRAYFPKLGEPTSCNLICLHNSHSIPHRFSLPDGTPCYSQRDDICIKGKCWETGCDGILGSRLRFDRCRVCGGDNSTCEEIKGVFNGNAMTPPGMHLRGLITAVRIPRGVTNAFVRKVSDRSTPYSSDSYDDFMLLIFEELKTQIRRGETREPFAGAELYYSGSRSREEIVSITGRLNKDVNIVIRVENTHTTQSLPTVEYSYFIDKSQQNSPLYFIAENEARLAEDRVNRRTGRSQNAVSLFAEPDKLMVPLQNNPTSEIGRQRKRQEKPQIYFVWRISELPTGCTTCAGNVTTHAECYPLVPKESERSQFSQFDLFRPVSDYRCSSTPRPPPVFRRCSDYCGVRWTAKPVPTSKSSNNANEIHTSSCSARCGEDKSKGIWRPAQLGEIVCHKAGLGSATSQPAYITCKGSCYPVYWTLSNWTKCSHSCGGGKRKRTLQCQDEIGENWPISECIVHGESVVHHLKAPKQVITFKLAQKIIDEYDQNNDPNKVSFEHSFYIEEFTDCFSLDDCRNDITWSVSEWSECEPLDDKMKSICRLFDSNVGNGQMTSCSVTCGTGMKQIKIPCERISLKHETDASNEKKVVLESIDIVNSDKCMESLQYIPRLSTDKMNRTVYVETIERQIIDKDAIPLKIDDINQPIVLPCNEDPCELRVPAWRTTSWSSCSSSCGLGVKQRQAMCVIEIQSNQPKMNPSKHDSEVYTSIFTASRSDVGIVDSQICHTALLPKPTEQETCLEAPCPVWRTEDWQECDGVCEYGIQRRQVRCVIELDSSQLSSNNLSTEEKNDSLRLLLNNPDSSALIRRSRSANVVDVDHERCRNAGIKPISERPCLINIRCPYWYKSEWSKCSVKCGMGMRSRQVDCRFPNETLVDTEIINNNQTDFQTSEIFPIRSLQKVVESIKQTSVLRYSCSTPRPIDVLRVKHVRVEDAKYSGGLLPLLSVERGPVHDAACNHLIRPVNWTICELFTCKTFEWSTGPWNSCPDTCGSRMKYRQITCVDDLGNEYSESLCPANLKPNSWSVCPNLCSDVPKSCWEFKHRFPSADDGTYQLLIESSLVYIYCANMGTPNPSEYITLRQINYAGSSEFLQPYPDSNWCPTFNGTASPFNSSENIYHTHSNIDLSKEISESLLTSMEVNAMNCPNCPSIPNLASKTFYHKIRLDIYKLEVKLDDARFSHTIGSSIMPYATAKDCFSSTVCPQGQFQIDLRGTGFQVSVKTHWTVNSNTEGISHIYRLHDGQVIRGRCGGRCTGCWPQPGLFLDVVTDQRLNHSIE
ncbi:unnamed protein product [Heterobilharzia americana]|nr:unnamed protein product [Heterobilharzia americana]